MHLMLYIVLSLVSHRAQGSQDVEILARIQGADGKIVVHHAGSGQSLPSVLASEDLIEVIKSLSPGDEAIVTGHLSYSNFNLEEKRTMTPVFVIEKIRPISLARLGKIETVPEALMEYSLPSSNYSPLGIPVTTEVASAITLTSALLLMQSLTASSTQPQTKQEINSGLVIFAGALATGVFVFEQIRDSIKSKKRN